MSVELKVNNAATDKQIKKLEKKKTKGGALAATASLLGSTAIQTAASLPGSIIAMKSLTSQNKNLSQEQISSIMHSADVFLAAKGLVKKGVVIENIESSSSVATSLLDKLKEYTDSMTSIAAGKNAGFLNKPVKGIFGGVLYDKNTILINQDKLSTAVFHEIGHAINYNNSKFWRAMQGLRVPGMLIASGLAIYCAFSNNAQPKDGKELTTGQKVKNTVRNNAGKIAFASMVPMLLEEGMASIRGCKWANANLPKDLAKKVLKSNIGAYCSYLGAAISLGIAAFSAVKIKDSLGKKHQEKINSKLDNLKNNSQN